MASHRRAPSVFLAAFGLALAVHVADGGVAEAQRGGTLVLEGDHPGAEVYVDAELVGTMPMEPLELAPGNHTLRVSRPGFTEYSEVLRIRPGRETVVAVELLAVSMELSVTTEPAGAQVFVDGTFSGETPLEIELAEGEHSIRLKAFGYHEQVRTLTAVAGQDDTLEVTLEALPPEVVAELTTPPEPEWYERPLTWVAIGGGALAVAAIVVLIVVLTSEGESQTDKFCNLSPDGSCFRFEFR